MNDEVKGIVLASLIGSIGIMWVLGGISLIMAGFEEHWAGLYFKVQRFLP